MRGRFCILPVIAAVLMVTRPAMTNALTDHPYAVDQLYRAAGKADFQGTLDRMQWSEQDQMLVMQPCSGADETSGVFVSKAIGAAFEFHEVLPSWNVELSEEKQGYRISLRFSRNGTEWSPWFHLGASGILANREHESVLSAEGWGKVDVDYMQMEQPARWFQYRVELASSVQPEPAGRTGLRRFFVSYSNTAENQKLYEEVMRRPPPGDDWMTSLPIPYRSQLWVPDRKLREEICCPTCVSMVLEGYGIDRRIATIAAEAFDAENHIYGTWPRASQTASRYGFEAWVDRFRSHDDVKRAIASGLPVIASARVSRGELRNAGYGVSGGGHLILIRGLNADGNYIVNDPYWGGPGGAEIVYHKDDIEKVWLKKGGVAIMIRRAPKESSNGKNGN